MAEYLARHIFGTSVIFESAGIRPQPAADAEDAIYTLKKNFNIDASKHLPRDVRSMDLATFCLVIALEKSAEKLLQQLGVPSDRVKLWKVRDPWGQDLTEYDGASLEIKRKVLQLKKSHYLQPQTPGSSTD
jgi:protein-tyrosine-phosphatase